MGCVFIDSILSLKHKDQGGKIMIKKSMITTLVVVFLLAVYGVTTEVQAVPFYITLNNLYKDGDFSAYESDNQTPTGWESVYDQNIIFDPQYENNLDYWAVSYASLYNTFNNVLYMQHDGVSYTQVMTQTPKITTDYYEMYENHNYYLEYQVKPYNNAHYLHHQIYDSNIGYIKNVFDSYLYPTNGVWTEVSGLFTVPQNEFYYLRFRTQWDSATTSNYVYYKNSFLYDFTDLYINTTSTNEFKIGIDDTTTNFFEADTIDPTTNCLSDTIDPFTGLQFTETTYNQYYYDLENFVNVGDYIYISFDSIGCYTSVDFNGETVAADSTQWTHHSFIVEADESFKLTIGNFFKNSSITSQMFFDNIMVFDLTTTFDENIPTLESFETDYLNKLPTWFDEYDVVIAEVYVANEGDLELGLISKDDFLKDYSHLYLAYQQDYTTFNIEANESAQQFMDECAAEVVFMNTSFDLLADPSTCEIDPNTINYPIMLELLQDGVVKSDLENDSYLWIHHLNLDYTNRVTRLNVTFNETLQYIRTIVIGLGDNSDLNDYTNITFSFYYRDFLVGYKHEVITGDLELWVDNAIVLNIYNTILAFDQVVISFHQSENEGVYETDLVLTELAFLRDNLVTQPIENTDLYTETDYLLTFTFEKESCGTFEFGCQLKNASLWLILDSPPAEYLWDKYGEVFGSVSQAAQTQYAIVEAFDTTGVETGLVSILGLITALITLMIYTLMQKLYK